MWDKKTIKTTDMKEGYPEQKELDLIKNWDYRDIFGLMGYIKERWEYVDWGYVTKWKKEDGHHYLHFELHTGGWSGNEDLIGAFMENRMVKTLYYAKWERGGHYTFVIDPYKIGFMTVKYFCINHAVSRQYIHKIKDRFEWLHISDRVKLIRPIGDITFKKHLR